MYGRLLIPVILFLLLPSPTVFAASESTVKSRMHWPPLFERTFGNPKISIGKRLIDRPTGVNYFYPTNKVIIKVNGQT